MMGLSIVIVSWNTRALLSQCLASVYANPPGCEFDVWVVDNASTDGSAAMVRVRFPSVRVIDSGENLGFARGSNRGAIQCTGAHVLFLNPDTVVKPGALNAMVEFLQANRDVGVAGALLLNADGTPQRSCAAFPGILSEARMAWGLDRPRRWQVPAHRGRDGSVETDWVPGAAMMLPRDALELAGGFDEGYFMYSEEVDLAYRLKNAGWRICMLPDAQVVHYGEQSTKLVRGKMKAQLFTSKVRFFRQHRGAAAARLLEFVFAGSILARRAMYGIRRENGQVDAWTEAWSAFRPALQSA